MSPVPAVFGTGLVAPKYARCYPSVMNKRQTEEAIVRTLVALKRAEKERRTIIYRDLAEDIVSYRAHFLGRGGEPDWSGRTGTYRLALRDLYSRADYSPEQADLTQHAVRYHVGNALRDRLTPAELERVGIDVESPQEKARRARRELLAELQEFRREQERKRKRAKKKPGGDEETAH